MGMRVKNQKAAIMFLAVFLLSSLVFRYWDEIKTALRVLFGG
jgi:hypothetical protein